MICPQSHSAYKFDFLLLSLLIPRIIPDFVFCTMSGKEGYTNCPITCHIATSRSQMDYGICFLMDKEFADNLPGTLDCDPSCPPWLRSVSFTSGFSSVIKDVLKNLFSRHYIAELSCLVNLERRHPHLLFLLVILKGNK